MCIELPTEYESNIALLSRNPSRLRFQLRGEQSSLAETAGKGMIPTALVPEDDPGSMRDRAARVALLAQVPGTFNTATSIVSTDVTFVRAGPVSDHILTFLRPGLDVPLLGSVFHLPCTRRLPSPIGANLVVTAAISRLYADRGLVVPKRHLVENRQIPAASVSWRLVTYIHFVVLFS